MAQSGGFHRGFFQGVRAFTSIATRYFAAPAKPPHNARSKGPSAASGWRSESARLFGPITWAELCCGLEVHNSPPELTALSNSLVIKDFDRQAAAFFGNLSRQFPARKNSFDRMIAAHAISLGITLVTNNAADFALYADAGLVVENWTTSA
ncbi:MAG: PIN domain-containing protein [Thiomonas sp.]